MTHPNIVPTQDDRQPAICEHGIRSPWACRECDEAALARHRQTHPVGDDADAMEYAVNLATVLRGKHYPEANGWTPSTDLLGVLLQIDNMTSGLVRAALTPARTLVGEDEVERVARAIGLANHETPETINKLTRDSHGELVEAWVTYLPLARAAIAALTPARTYEQGIEDAAQAAYKWWDGEPEDAEDLRAHIRALGTKDND